MGILLSLSGVDNAGKTTQSELLVKYFRSKNLTILVTEFAFGYYLLKPLVKLLRKSTGSASGGPVTKNKIAVYKLWFILAFVDIWLGYLFHIRPLKTKYDVVMCDRFYTDIWANLIYYGYAPRWAYEKMLRFLPKSEMSFILMIDPAIGYRRINDEFPISYYKQQVGIYKKLAELSSCILIDASQSKKEVFSDIQGYIVKLSIMNGQ